jgi:hypothetical protein
MATVNAAASRAGAIAFIYVVYRCGEHWDRFELYDAAPTLPAQLQFVEEPE